MHVLNAYLPISKFFLFLEIGNTEYKDAYLLLSTADIIENEHISISKQAFLPRMSLSLHKNAQQNLVSIV